ncbi:YciC family protein [Sphingoaurantiacus capsulatus]|uniref:YciC family protein n=1 Tax=Sphingoaurantiacus capsulatus TaxID=1771310 RepID=A0ABV7X6J5_9SPHN
MSGWTIGSIWEETRAIVREQAWVFAPVAAAFVLLPSLAVARFFPDNRQSLMELPSDEALCGQIASAMISVIAEAFILIVALRRDGGRSVSQLIAEGIRLTPALFAVKLIIGIATGLGLMLLILPGMYILGRLGLAPAAMVAERVGILEALRRAWELGRRDFWRIFLFLALILLATVGAMIMLVIVANAVALVLRVVGIEGIDTFLRLLTSTIAVTVVTVYGWTGIAVIYRRIAGVS